jgi:tRNA (cytidine/uridine-2'-O-)-methyltransferase
MVGFHIVLFEPEIPPNTGNIMRLCANAPAGLHLIHPLGFDLDDRRLRRAGLDYREWSPVREYRSLAEFEEKVPHERLFALTTRGARCYADVSYQDGDVFLFGPETRGLPERILQDVAVENRLFLPMMQHSRSPTCPTARRSFCMKRGGKWRLPRRANAKRIRQPSSPRAISC